MRLALPLLLLATLAAFGADPPEPRRPSFADVTESAGIRFHHRFGDNDLSNIVEGTGAGAAPSPISASW